MEPGALICVFIASSSLNTLESKNIICLDRAKPKSEALELWYNEREGAEVKYCGYFQLCFDRNTRHDANSPGFAQSKQDAVSPLKLPLK